MEQREFIHDFNKKYRASFNDSFFNRSDDDLINAIKHVVYSCERDSVFKIKVLNFEIIDRYDDVNHILWEYEEAIINKNKPSSEPVNSKKQINVSKKKENSFGYINLKDSDLKLIKITYYIEINEKKNGWVNDTLSVYIAIPRIVDGFYFRLNGNVYSAIYQIVDASTYNNSAAKNSKKQSVTFKSLFMATRVYRYSATLFDINGTPVPAVYFIVNIFKKSLLLIKYFLAKMSLQGTLSFLHLEDIFILDDISGVDQEINYIFPARNFYIVCPKIVYDAVQICQSMVYTLSILLNSPFFKHYSDAFDSNVYIRSLGADFTTDMSIIYDKGQSILGSLEFIYDEITKADLKLEPDDKDDIYKVLRWIMYEFNSLRQKDNLDITTKKIRYAEYLASYYATKLAKGIYRISDKASGADLGTMRKALQIPPLYLINAITKCELVNYKNCVNDMDALVALKYTYKGISGIGERSNAISSAYRSIHPSHLGKVDIDSSSNSDPGVSGTICPLATLYDGHFSDYTEVSEWREKVAQVIDQYRSIKSRQSFYRLVNETKNEPVDPVQDTLLQDCIEVTYNLLNFPINILRQRE